MVEKIALIIEELDVKREQSQSQEEHEAYTFAINKLCAMWEEVSKNIDLPVEVVCKDCSVKFSIGPNEKAWYNDNNLFLPKRCPTCRDIRKKAAKEKLIDKKLGRG